MHRNEDSLSQECIESAYNSKREKSITINTSNCTLTTLLSKSINGDQIYISIKDAKGNHFEETYHWTEVIPLKKAGLKSSSLYWLISLIDMNIKSNKGCFQLIEKKDLELKSKLNKRRIDTCKDLDNAYAIVWSLEFNAFKLPLQIPKLIDCL